MFKIPQVEKGQVIIDRAMDAMNGIDRAVTGRIICFQCPSFHPPAGSQPIVTEQKSSKKGAMTKFGIEIPNKLTDINK